MLLKNLAVFYLVTCQKLLKFNVWKYNWKYNHLKIVLATQSVICLSGSSVWWRYQWRWPKVGFPFVNLSYYSHQVCMRCGCAWDPESAYFHFNFCNLIDWISFLSCAINNNSNNVYAGACRWFNREYTVWPVREKDQLFGDNHGA